jgi:hypothetical protein
MSPVVVPQRSSTGGKEPRMSLSALSQEKELVRMFGSSSSSSSSTSEGDDDKERDDFEEDAWSREGSTRGDKSTQDDSQPLLPGDVVEGGVSFEVGEDKTGAELPVAAVKEVDAIQQPLVVGELKDDVPAAAGVEEDETQLPIVEDEKEGDGDGELKPGDSEGNVIPVASVEGGDTGAEGSVGAEKFSFDESANGAEKAKHPKEFTPAATRSSKRTQDALEVVEEAGEGKIQEKEVEDQHVASPTHTSNP